jgi:putative flippase GtrA
VNGASPALTQQPAAPTSGHAHPVKTRLARYTAGSVVAATSSEVTFVVVLGVVHASAAVATVVAFLAGAVPNWWLNRRWVWASRSRATAWRELLPYVFVVVATLLITTTVTGVVAAAVRGLSHWVAVCIIDAAFLAVTGVLFVTKFVVFDRVVFSRRVADA